MMNAALKLAYDSGVTWVESGFWHTDAVRAVGLELRMWDVNSLEKLRQAKTLGATGFTCDYWRKPFRWADELGDVELLR